MDYNLKIPYWGIDLLRQSKLIGKYIIGYPFHCQGPPPPLSTKQLRQSEDITKFLNLVLGIPLYSYRATLK